MQKISTVQAGESKVFKARQLTIGLDLGDRSSFYCVFNDAGEVILERNLSTKALTQVFGRMAGAESPWRRERTPQGSAGY
jgi:transposase